MWELVGADTVLFLHLGEYMGVYDNSLNYIFMFYVFLYCYMFSDLKNLDNI